MAAPAAPWCPRRCSEPPSGRRRPRAGAALPGRNDVAQLTVLEPEGLYPDSALEERVFGPGVRVLQGAARSGLAEVPDALCAEADGLMTMRMPVPADQLA